MAKTQSNEVLPHAPSPVERCADDGSMIGTMKMGWNRWSFHEDHSRGKRRTDDVIEMLSQGRVEAGERRGGGERMASCVRQRRMWWNKREGDMVRQPLAIAL